MRLKHLSLHNFRNYLTLSLDLPEVNLVIFKGKNAEGKTNLLESIYLLIVGKSFRTNTIAELIQWNHENSIIAGVFDNTQREIILSQTFRHHKSIKQNNKPVKISAFVQHIPVILFTPEDLYQMTTHSAFRRRYLDRILTQTDPQYFDHHIQFSRILMQRNALLREIKRNYGRVHELDPWDQEFGEHCVYINAQRAQLIQKLNEHLSMWYQSISSTSETVRLAYKPSFPPTDQKETIEVAKWRQLLVENREKDLALGSTTIGPHRDDFSIYMNGHQAQQFASRGELRSLIMALKRSELEYLENSTGKPPIALLDDIFSELDEGRQKQLIFLLEPYQTFITTTDLPHNLPQQKGVYEVEYLRKIKNVL